MKRTRFTINPRSRVTGPSRFLSLGVLAIAAILVAGSLQTAEPETVQPIRFKVISPSITISLTEDGAIAAIQANRFEGAIRGVTRWDGCHVEGKTTAQELPGGGVQFTRGIRDAQNHFGRVIERFTPTPDSVRWEVEMTGEGEYWTTPIITQLACPNSKDLLWWTAWSDPERRGEAWRDPLELRPFVACSWHYGNAAQISPVGGDFVAIPLATVVSLVQDGGFSLVLSPEDVLLNMTVAASASGDIRFSRTNHRLGGGKTVHFAMDLVGHEADWRGGLRWMAARYPAFFDPPNPKADAMAGCGAYSGDERPIDAAKFTRMAFRISWKLSDDFPYMGMFIPPVKNADERWTRSCGEPAPTGKGDTISCRQMNDYGRWMRQHGFHVLNYFNVTEFGKDMKDAEILAARAGDPDLWKDPVAFAKLRLPHAIFRKQPPSMYYGAWLVDVGDSAYREFMLEQARRHIALLPDTDGICIDRMDWLRFYNPDGDDGVSWVDGRPARSLYQSWHAFMAELGPLMRRADKVIFGNTMTMRLELNRHLDGIYTEHGNNPGALNAAALMGIRKPVLAWTYNKTLNEPNADDFFQRHLHLGVYPTAPYPFNHHCINPEPEAERLFMDYGPLLDAMRGKKWVLAVRCVEAVTPGVKVNLFQVPGGYAVPVTFGGQTSSAAIRLRLPGKLDTVKIEALHPGTGSPVPLPAAVKDGALELRVPLERGCAMLKIRSASESATSGRDTPLNK